jgi:general secretion pathway protein M
MLNAAAAELPGLRAQLATLQAAASARKIVLDGTSDAIASANLQRRIEELGTSTGVTISSTEAVAAENRGAYRRIGLRLAVSAGYAAIVKLLGAINAAAPPLVLSNLQIHGIVRPTGDQSNARLDAGLEVYGFRNSEAPLPLQR